LTAQTTGARKTIPHPSTVRPTTSQTTEQAAKTYDERTPFTATLVGQQFTLRGRSLNTDGLTATITEQTHPFLRGSQGATRQRLAQHGGKPEADLIPAVQRGLAKITTAVLDTLLPTAQAAVSDPETQQTHVTEKQRIGTKIPKAMTTKSKVKPKQTSSLTAQRKKSPATPSDFEHLMLLTEQAEDR